MPPSNSGPMPDEMEAKALESLAHEWNKENLIDKIKCLHCGCGYGTFGMPVICIKRIATALRSARADAFEEAAQFCERKDRDGRNDFDNGWSHRGVTLARQLREKAKP